MRSSLIGLLIVGLAGSASAGMRCDEYLIERGFTFIEVLERCGKPDAKYQRISFLVHGVYIPVEEWFYELGSNKFRRLLTFENGRLERIELRPKPIVAIEQLSER